MIQTRFRSGKRHYLSSRLLFGSVAAFLQHLLPPLQLEALAATKGLTAHVRSEVGSIAVPSFPRVPVEGCDCSWLVRGAPSSHVATSDPGQHGRQFTSIINTHQHTTGSGAFIKKLNFILFSLRKLGFLISLLLPSSPSSAQSTQHISLFYPHHSSRRDNN